MWEYLKPGARVRVSSNDFYNNAVGVLSTHKMIGDEWFHHVIFDRPVVFRNVSHITGIFANSELIELDGGTCLN